MKTITRRQIKAIHEQTAEAFEAEVNKVLADHPEAVINYNMSLGFCAFIEIENELDKPETMADRFHLEGIYYHCRNCPHLEDPHDKRRKWCACDIAPYGKTYRDGEACEWFYKSLASGAITQREIIED